MMDYLIPSIFIFGCSLILGIPLSFLAMRLKLIDIPFSAPHKQHARPTPLAGGLLIITSLAILTITFQDFLNRDVLSVLFGTFIVFCFGLLDDYRGLSAFPKLIGQVIASVFLIVSGIQVNLMTYLLGEGGSLYVQGMNIFITLFWLIGITNAMNLIDSMDGIVAGVVMIYSSFFIGATIFSNQPVLTFWSSGLLGISIGLYFWNAVAKRFFLGDSGSQSAGFLLAAFGILYSPLDKNPTSSWIVPIMLLGVPILDTSLVVYSRWKRGQPIGSGRRDHIYHRFIRLGYKPRWSVVLVHLMGLIVSTLAFLTLYLPPLTALLVFMSMIAGGMVFLLWLERKPTLDSD